MAGENPAVLEPLNARDPAFPLLHKAVLSLDTLGSCLSELHVLEGNWEKRPDIEVLLAIEWKLLHLKTSWGVVSASVHPNTCTQHFCPWSQWSP